MSDSSSARIISSDEDGYTKPEQFSFHTEEWTHGCVVTIVPTEFFEANEDLDEEAHDEIADLLAANGFVQMMESSFVPSDESMDSKEIDERMKKLGFKQTSSFDRYMEETAEEFPLEEIFFDDKFQNVQENQEDDQDDG